MNTEKSGYIKRLPTSGVKRLNSSELFLSGVNAGLICFRQMLRNRYLRVGTNCQLQVYGDLLMELRNG